ncbi:MAG TPA: CBS domain-containing protein [Patescibacteria group bacterium]|nr:CBS domain-containing protein [Patescibacteria group bacterium]
MMISICGLLLLALGLLAMALQRYYSSIPSKELKRLAARGDHLAAALYRPVAYGASMRLLLWMIFSFSFAFGALFVSYGMPGAAALGVIALTMASIVFLQSVRLTVRSANVAVKFAPALNWVLSYLHPLFNPIIKAVNKYRVHERHSGLYEKEDLLALLRQQKGQVDNRIAQHDLETLERVVQFDDRQAADAFLAMSRVKMVKVDDHIGPILLKELHDSGQSSFLVYDGSPEKVVGTILLRDAVQAKHGGRVGDLVHPKLVYVHEDFSLSQVMQAFAQSGQFMVVVINSFEEAVGIITLEQLLSELIGLPVNAEEAVSYEDRAAVAAFRPAKSDINDQSESDEESAEEQAS